MSRINASRFHTLAIVNKTYDIDVSKWSGQEGDTLGMLHPTQEDRELVSKLTGDVVIDYGKKKGSGKREPSGRVKQEYNENVLLVIMLSVGDDGKPIFQNARNSAEIIKAKYKEVIKKDGSFFSAVGNEFKEKCGWDIEDEVVEEVKEEMAVVEEEKEGN